MVSTITVSGISDKLPPLMRKNIIDSITKNLPWENEIAWKESSSGNSFQGIEARTMMEKGKWRGRISISSRDMAHHEDIFHRLEGLTIMLAHNQLVCSTSNTAGIKFVTKVALQ